MWLLQIIYKFGLGILAELGNSKEIKPKNKLINAFLSFITIKRPLNQPTSSMDTYQTNQGSLS